VTGRALIFSQGPQGVGCHKNGDGDYEQEGFDVHLEMLKMGRCFGLYAYC
jgi:hypothetical protein